MQDVESAHLLIERDTVHVSNIWGVYMHPLTEKCYVYINSVAVVCVVNVLGMCVNIVHVCMCYFHAQACLHVHVRMCSA